MVKKLSREELAKFRDRQNSLMTNLRKYEKEQKEASARNYREMVTSPNLYLEYAELVKKHNENKEK